MGTWRGNYQLADDGRPVAVWDPSWWRSGGDFEVDGRRYQVRAGTWGTSYRMADEMGGEVAMSFEPDGLVCTIYAPLTVYEQKK